MAARETNGWASSRSGTGQHTGIELGTGGLQSALVVNADGVALLGLPVTLNRQGHVDLELVCSQGTDGGRGEKGEREQEALHGWRQMAEKRSE